MSQFEAGHPKFGGRKRGAPNKSLAFLRDALDQVGLDLPSRLTELMPLLSPDKQADVLLNLMQYIYPKRKPSDSQPGQGQPLTFIDIVRLARSGDASEQAPSMVIEAEIS
jgi:hypothetical protein